MVTTQGSGWIGCNNNQPLRAPTYMLRGLPRTQTLLWYANQQTEAKTSNYEANLREVSRWEYMHITYPQVSQPKVSMHTHGHVRKRDQLSPVGVALRCIFPSSLKVGPHHISSSVYSGMVGFRIREKGLRLCK